MTATATASDSTSVQNLKLASILIKSLLALSMTKSFEPLEEFEIVFNSGFTKLASTFRKNNVEGEKKFILPLATLAMKEI